MSPSEISAPIAASTGSIFTTAPITAEFALTSFITDPKSSPSIPFMSATMPSLSPSVAPSSLARLPVTASIAETSSAISQ